MSIANFFILTGAICSVACVVIVFLLWLWDDREDVKSLKKSVRKLHDTISDPFPNPSNTKPGNEGLVHRPGVEPWKCFDCGAELNSAPCWNCGRE